MGWYIFWGAGQDIEPFHLIFDIDGVLAFQKGKSEIYRGWLVIGNATDLIIDVEWKDFLGGFSIHDVECSETDRSPSGRPRFCYRIPTGFPEGLIRVNGSSPFLIRSTKTVEHPELKLPFEVRISLASDEEIYQVFRDHVW